MILYGFHIISYHMQSQHKQSTIDSLPEPIRNFYQFHGIQMLGSEMPVTLIETLYNKLIKGIYDGGDFLDVTDNEEAEQYEVRAKTDLKARSNIFIIDHALTFRYPDLRKILNENQGILPRLQAILKYQQNLKQLPAKQIETKENVTGEEEPILELEFDSMELEEISGLEFPPNLMTLSLVDNKLANEDDIIKKLQYLNLRVLWLNGNPIVSSEKLSEYINTKTKIEIYNSKFTANVKEWGVKYAHSRSLSLASNASSSQINVLNVDGRNIYNVSLEIWSKFTNLRSLSIKDHELKTQQQKEYLKNLLKTLKNLKYLYVDDAVEIQLGLLAKNKEIPQNIFKNLLVNKHSLHFPLAANDSQLDSIQGSVFKVAGCYRLANTEQLDQSSIWYVNDELGSMLPHSDTPNVKIMPFLFAKSNKMDGQVIAYSIMWPIKDIAKDQLVSRDYLWGMTEERQRSSRLAAWYQLPFDYYEGEIKKYDEKMFELNKDSIQLLQKFYSKNSIKQKQYIAQLLTEEYQEPKHKVITDYQYINEYLKHPSFTLTSNLEEATIVWLVGAAEEEEWKKYKGKFFLNQFPYQSCVVNKNNLADTVQSVFGDTKFLQRTYNLEKQLPLMVGDFYRREKQGLDNLWILKPPNMARSMDMIITDNLSLIIRAMETGPKIAQKYISNPVLRRGRKVDLRYILLVKSIEPLTLFLYKNFWIRSGNNEYTTDRRQLSTYQTQFTVMNYGKVSNFQQIKYQQFIQEFQKDYAPTKWNQIHDKIKKMLRNVFIAVATKYPEMHDPKSRAVYGIDIMVEDQSFEPKLLEITFSPDCKRACEYYPTFYDDVFQTLWTEEVSANMERVI